MALDKNDLLSLVATNLPDNTAGGITPAKHREVDEQSITSAANLAETTDQTFLGNVYAPNISPFDAATEMLIERLLEGESDLDEQNPTGLGIANSLKVSFGDAEGVITDPVMIDVDGKITFNDGGLVRVTTLLQFGREGASGVSDLFFRYLVNGAQLGRSINQHLANSNSLGYFEITNWFNAPAGVTLELEIMRDLNGNNSGGLRRHTLTDEGVDTWNPSPCAIIRVERLVSA